MIYRPAATFTYITITAASPLLLHGQPEHDCTPRIELCQTSYLFSVSDEQQPEHSPELIFASSVAAFTGSTVSMPAYAGSSYKA
jgi:hypothetical protein